MQVKKFEAPTLQEALDHVKRELGPEAIILQTKKYKRGFGLMSKPSVEVTAAISDRSVQKKTYVEARLPEKNKEVLSKLSADRQAEFYDKYAELRTKVRGGAGTGATAQGAKPKITATRYIEIDEDEIPAPVVAKPATRAPVVNAAQPAVGAPPSGMTVEDEVKHLKRMIEEMKNVQDDSSFGVGAQAMTTQSRMSTPALQSAFEQLVMNGVDKRYAFDLIKRVSFELGDESSNDPDAVTDLLAAEVMRNTEVTSPLNGIAPQNGTGPAVIALVGPTGVGKTTTVAKIASDAILKRGLKVGLINLDGYKVAAFDQLATYARILNVPFRSAGSSEDFQAAIQDFQSLDLILIDTTGRSQKDPSSLTEMQKLLQSVPHVRTQIVLSVTTRDSELYDMANRFSIFHPEGIIVSKLDEGTIYGAVFNVSQKAKLPLVYFTTGQRVPEDIEEATQERVAALILDI
jgi:flagellar biosynthesis protein FlhF